MKLKGKVAIITVVASSIGNANAQFAYACRRQ
jgi:hypothetical protein